MSNSVPLDRVLPATHKIALVLEGIGDDKRAGEAL
jgi:hypothetical protein